MKKIILSFLMLFLSLSLFGCVDQNKYIPKSDSITITKHIFEDLDMEQTITIDSEEVVNYIVDNINSLTLSKLDYIKPTELMYTLTFYNSSKEVEEIRIKSHYYVSIGNNPYAVKKGELDIDYIESLFDTTSIDDNIEKLIKDTYKEKYDMQIEPELNKIYKQFDKEGKLVVPFMMWNGGDEVIWSETVGSICFHYHDSRKIEVYYENDIFTLQEAFNNELLTQENLIDIAKIQNINCELGHSWNEGELIQVPGGGEDMLYTCLVCGETKTERVSDGETYSLSFIGAVEYLKNDISGEYAPTSTITVVTEILTDADIEVYANGEKVPPVTKDMPSDGLYYQFGMPSEDVVVEIKVITIEYTYLHDLDDYGWVNELDKNDIIKVRYESSAAGIAPGNLVDIVYSIDPADISNLYNAIILSQYVEAKSEDAIIDGGGYKKYDFITNDNVYSILISNGFVKSNQNHDYIDVQETKYYKFLGEYYTFKNPSLECNSFLVYNPSYKAYTVENDTLIGEYSDLDEFEFVPYDGPIPEWLTYCYIETSFGRVYIHTENIIYLKDGNTCTYYEIVGDKDFSFL